MKRVKRIFHFFHPPKGWKLPVIILMGIIAGMFFFMLHISRATSYLSDSPTACINCHVMYTQYATWAKSSHSHAATCSDCHVPQDNFFRQYYFKASDGLRHATFFTMRWEPQSIVIKPAGIGVVQENCIRCHMDLVDMTQLVEVTGKMAQRDDGKLCWDCHRGTPHGTVRSLSSTPHSLVERLPSVMPSWLEGFIEQSPR